MKRALLLLLPVSLLVALAISGCNDESKPAFTRVRVYPDCGVAPLQVEGLAIVSGGNETGNPTGGNNNLEIKWEFGDGGSSQTSIAYHTYSDADDYVVTVTATDPDGNKATATYPVTVLADSLLIQATSDYPEGAVTTADTVNFDLWARSCEIDPEVESDYVRMNFRWNIEGTVINTRQVAYQFLNPGSYDVILAVDYPALSVTRKDTLSFTVTAP